MTQKHQNVIEITQIKTQTCHNMTHFSRKWPIKV